MRVISFNCEGIDTAAEKGFFRWVLGQDVDVICLQNTQRDDVFIEKNMALEGYFCYAYGGYNRQEKPGGVVIYSRVQPKAIITGLGYPEADETGRYIQADFHDLSIGSLYVPEVSDQEDKELKYRFLDGYGHHLNKQRRKRREFIICGTWNIVSQDQDASACYKEGELGLADSEYSWMRELFRGMNFCDAYREVDRELDRYSFWKDAEAREKNEGARFDYQIITKSLKPSVLNGGIYTSSIFSRHAPVIIDYEWEFSEAMPFG